ncbi:OsmC family protein [Kineosporia sp. J2-2]|uniref:OsmC family protein n=1 Tax=Kineosporia corallincola TaxID=2835133 RepID=A0ABS5TQ20_9ACTN|nr:OsmC family protein [Kineosporia corallincola]MBT0773209.1 OsmC family protein [Kineosporia corallincola]
MTVHTYPASISWQGSTGAGYDAYPRGHSAGTAPGDHTLALSADPAFRGDPGLLNPEQLLVLAAGSCQLLSFLAVAAHRGVDVLSYTDRPTGRMDDEQRPARVAVVELRPTIGVAPGTDHEKVLRLVDLAHRGCFVANSLSGAVTIDATVVTA